MAVIDAALVFANNVAAGTTVNTDVCDLGKTAALCIRFMYPLN